MSPMFLFIYVSSPCCFKQNVVCLANTFVYGMRAPHAHFDLQRALTMMLQIDVRRLCVQLNIAWST